jgi:hypothetical protein
MSSSKEEVPWSSVFAKEEAPYPDGLLQQAFACTASCCSKEGPTEWGNVAEFKALKCLGDDLGPSCFKIEPKSLPLPLVLEERGEVVNEETGEAYVGQWGRDKYHGYGSLTKPNGSWYEGEFSQGKAHGHGRLVAPNGNVYSGQWVNDCADGYGKYIHEDGCTYAGEWSKNDKDGNGIERWADGSKFEGSFNYGQKFGRGKFTDSSGTVVYEGEFMQDKMHGEGIFNFPDGKKYTGQYAYGHIHGYGEMLFPDGSEYQGEFSNDLRHGAGTFTWSDGQKAIGSWSHGKQDGEATIIDSFGNERTSVWVMGREDTSTSVFDSDAQTLENSATVMTPLEISGDPSKETTPLKKQVIVTTPQEEKTIPSEPTETVRSGSKSTAHSSNKEPPMFDQRASIEIVVEKKGQKSWGMKLVHEEAGLCVNDITDGAVKRHNGEGKEEIRIGDLIRSVNHKVDTPTALSAELRDSLDIVHLVIDRPPKA